jgi:hypothetical protein
VSELRLTHIGGPIVFIEVEGWRLLSDPTFEDAARARSCAGWSGRAG